MRTFLITICCFTLMGITVNAQDQKIATVGLKTGMAISNKYGDDGNGTWRTSFTVGVTLDVRLGDEFYLLTGLDYIVKGSQTKKGTEWPKPAENPQWMLSMKENPTYLQMPFRFGYKFYIGEDKDFSIMPYGGLYIAYGIGGKTIYTYKPIDGSPSFEEKNPTFDVNVSKFDYGAGLGFTAEYRHVVLSAEHDWGLKPFAKNYNDLKNKCISITLGYKF